MSRLDDLMDEKRNGNGILSIVLNSLLGLIFLTSGYFTLMIPNTTWKIILTIVSFVIAGFFLYKLGFTIASFVIMAFSFILLVINKWISPINPLSFQFAVMLIGVIGFILFYTFIIKNKKKLGETTTVIISGLILLALIVAVFVFGKF